MTARATLLSCCWRRSGRCQQSGRYTPDVALLELAVTALDPACPPGAERLEHDELLRRRHPQPGSSHRRGDTAGEVVVILGGGNRSQRTSSVLLCGRAPGMRLMPTAMARRAQGSQRCSAPAPACVGAILRDLDRCPWRRERSCRPATSSVTAAGELAEVRVARRPRVPSIAPVSTRSVSLVEVPQDDAPRRSSTGGGVGGEALFEAVAGGGRRER